MDMEVEDDAHEDVAVKLAMEWEKHPGLYVTTCNDYRDVDYKAAALKSIGKEIGCSVPTVKTKMKSLRTMLARAVKCPPSGSVRKKLPKKQEWVKENLKFLLPYMNIGKTTTNLKAQANTPSDFEEGLERKEDSNYDSDGHMVEEEKVVEGREKLPDDPEVPPMTSEGQTPQLISCRTVHHSRQS
ncbi:uncharacterized protein LOC135491577 [Lineus longissimus]|uniref:uncharacterized protein LOC135491577 n=1 Tax=Lineus longissimus TaxID=88925 RepID=UPI00315C9FE3